jgi:hypothetical protein
MRAGHVDDDAFGRLAEIEGIHEILDRSVEQLPLDPVGPHAAIGADARR